MRKRLFCIFFNLFCWVVVCFAGVHLFIYMNKQPIWSPVDEPAHMDYIEKLSYLKWPAATDSPVEQTILQSYAQTNWNQSEPNDTAIGLLAYSYELQQPPLYYLIMAVPNRLMIMTQVSLIKRVLVLRYISWSIFLFGLAIGAILIHRIMCTYFYRDYWFMSALYVLFGLLTGSFNRYGLSNDWLSLLLANMALAAAWRFKNKPTNLHAIFALIILMLLTLSKQSNFPLAFLVIIWMVYSLFTQAIFSRKMLLYGLLIFSPFLFWFLRLIFFSDFNNPVSDTFLETLPAGLFKFNFFIALLTDNMFQVSHLFSSIQTPGVWVWFFLLLSAIMTTFFRPFRSLFLKIGVVLLLIACMWFVLNKWVGGVHWFAYRHYAGYSIFLFLGLTVWVPTVLYYVSSKKK